MKVEVDSSLIDQLEERLLTMTVGNHTKEQLIIKLEREIKRKDLVIADLYQQVHGRPLKGVF